MVIEAVSTIRNFVIPGDGIWEIGQGFSDGSGINNQKFWDHRGWNIALGICDS